MVIKQDYIPAVRVGLLALVLLSCSVGFVYVHLVSGSDAARLEPGQNVWRREGLVITPLRLDPEGLQPGDVVTAVRGRSLEAWLADLLHWRAPGPAWKIGEQVQYTVLRAGQRLDLTITLGAYPLLAVLTHNWGTFVFSLVAQLVGVFLFVSRPADPTARALFLWGTSIFSASTWSMGLQISDLVGGAGFWLYVVTSMGAYLIYAASGLHIALVFPEPHPLVRRHPRLITAVYAVPFAIFGIYLAVTRLVAADTLDWMRYWFPGESAVFLGCLALGVLIWARAYRKYNEPELRQKVRWVLYAACVCGSAALVLWLIPATLLGTPLISGNAVGLLVLPFPLAFAIAVLRYHLLDIDVIINRTLVYVPLTAFLAGIYAAVVALSQKFFLAVTGAQSDAAIVLTTLLLVAIFTPVKNALQAFVDKHFKESADSKAALRGALAQAQGVLRVLDADAMAERLLQQAVRAVQARGGAISLDSPDDVPVRYTCGQWTGQAAISLPLESRGLVLGTLMVAGRSSGVAYSKQDREILSLTATVLADAVLTSRALHRAAPV